MSRSTAGNGRKSLLIGLLWKLLRWQKLRRLGGVGRDGGTEGSWPPPAAPTQELGDLLSSSSLSAQLASPSRCPLRARMALKAPEWT